MKEKIVAKTKWEYYVANVFGILCLIALFIWQAAFAFTDEGIDFVSIFPWSALFLLIVIPFSLISFFSSMKTVEATTKDLTISYVFQKHRNVVLFSEVVEMTSRPIDKRNSGSIRASFKLILADGRAFDFAQSQFDRYRELKALCRKHVKS